MWVSFRLLYLFHNFVWHFLSIKTQNTIQKHYLGVSIILKAENHSVINLSLFIMASCLNNLLWIILAIPFQFIWTRQINHKYKLHPEKREYKSTYFNFQRNVNQRTYNFELVDKAICFPLCCNLTKSLHSQLKSLGAMARKSGSRRGGHNNIKGGARFQGVTAVS